MPICETEKGAPNRELGIRLWIDARPETCWQVLTKRTAEWWCPAPWRVTLDHFELHAGGRCTMTMHGPDGESHASDGLFIEVVEGERFVTTDAIVRDEAGALLPRPAFMLGGWELLPDRGGTLYYAWARHWTDEACAEHEAMGFTEGWQAVADQFKQLCEAAEALR